MLDTNICIYVMNKRHAKMARQFNHYMGEMCISSITYAELMHGIERSERKAHNRDQVDAFCRHLVVLDFDRGAAKLYGQIRAQLESQGLPIGANDLLIAAHACSQALTLVSNNTREFARVDGLKLDNWVKDA